ncbi:MAG: FTR1 family protein [Gammaproteobacteria bacterium]
MIAALIIVFREVLEAALVIGIVLAATRGLPAATRWVFIGVLAGLAGAGLVAQFAGVISQSLEGYGQETFNAGVLLLAVVMLAWHNVWMATHGRRMAGQMRSVGDAVRRGARPLCALAVVVGLAVMREGAETVLFLYGLAASDGGFVDALIGGFAGLSSGAIVGAALYLGLLRIPLRYLFGVTAWMIALLAAGMAAQAMTFLAAADLLTLGPVLWDTSAVLRQSGLVGKILHTLIGYMDRPTEVHVVAYLATLLVIQLATWLVNRRQTVLQQSMAAE